MAAKTPYQNYQQNAVFSAAPEELTTMLYNRLLRDLKQALSAVQKKDIQATHDSLMHAQDIIAYLNSTLNTGYEIGRNFELIYEYMNRRLIEANINKNPEIIQEITGYVEEIRDAWVTAVKQLKKNAG